MMKKLLKTVGLVAALACTGSVSAGVINDFSGVYAPDQWTEILDGGSISAGPTAVSLTGANDFLQSSSSTRFEIVVAGTGNISFDWLYITQDIDPFFDEFGYFLDGLFTSLININDASQIFRSESIFVTQGQIFAFAQESDDRTGGSATTRVTNFVGPMDPARPLPEPTVLALMGLGLLGVGFFKKR